MSPRGKSRARPAYGDAMRTFLALAIVLSAASVSGCGGGGGAADLTPSAVQNIPAGDARGAALGAVATMRRRTTGCAGVCSVRVGTFTSSICDVGEVDDQSVTVTQSDGVLMVDLSDTPGHYEGGVDADGSYDIGAYATQFGGAVHITVRVEGTITPASMTGAARSHTWGRVEDQNVDCWGSYDVSSVP